MRSFLLKSLPRRLPLVALVIAAVLGLVYLGRWLNFEALAANREWLITLRNSHYALTATGFILTYIAVVLTSVPGAVILTITGGFLFGTVAGTAFNVLAAWLGAMTVFLAARTGLGHEIAAHIANRGGRVARLQAALLENEWSVLFSMRLIPVLPFFVTNLVPALVGVRFPAFALTTALGLLPVELIYTMLGAGLGDVFSGGEVPQLDILLLPEILVPILGLALLALSPLLLRLLRRARP